MEVYDRGDSNYRVLAEEINNSYTRDKSSWLHNYILCSLDKTTVDWFYHTIKHTTIHHRQFITIFLSLTVKWYIVVGKKWTTEKATSTYKKLKVNFWNIKLLNKGNKIYECQKEAFVGNIKICLQMHNYIYQMITHY